MSLDPDVFAALIDTIERFVRDELQPLEAQVDAEDQVPPATIEAMRTLGLFGLTIPEKYGGLGLTAIEEIEVAVRLGHAAPAFRSVFGTNIGIGSQAIVIDGTDEQRAYWLPKLASGEVIASFCLTEPDSGSDAGSLRTRAEADGEHFMLNGTKRYITNAPRAGLFTVFARTDAETKGSKGVSAFLVPADTPGVHTGTPEHKMGQRGAPVSDVIFDNARLPKDSLIGGTPNHHLGFRTAMRVLDRGRLHIAAFCAGMSERLVGEMVRFARERRQFGKAIGEFQLVQAMIADSHAEAYAATAMVRDAARRFTAGPATTEVACVKMFASEALGRIADRAVQVHGGAGYIRDYAVERLYRDARLFRIYEGTTQIQQLIIARGLLAA